jgi:hypothetical protein
MKVKCEIYRDNFQKYKKYGITKGQLVIADVPYNLGNNMYGSNPMLVDMNMIMRMIDWMHIQVQLI